MTLEIRETRTADRKVCAGVVSFRAGIVKYAGQLVIVQPSRKGSLTSAGSNYPSRFQMIEVIKMSPHHWPAVREIYLEGIETGNATFELDAPPWKKWDEVHHAFGRVLAIESEVIRGWAAMTPVSSRTAYSGVADVSVYVAAHSRGSGVGRLLLNALIAESEENDIWTLQAGIFPENEASIALHKRCGFREVGRRERIGKLNGIWRSTLLLERRSELVGTR